MTAMFAICSQYHSPFQYMCCSESIGCAADLTRVLPIWKSRCNDSIAGWDTVYVFWPRRRDPKRGGECVDTVAASHVALIEVLGCVEADHNREGREADRTIEQVATVGKQGKSFFSLSPSLSFSLSLSFFFLSQIFLSIMCSNTEFLFFCSAGLELWLWVQAVKIKRKSQEDVLGRNKTCETIQKLWCWTKSTASTSQEPISNWMPEERELH